MSANNLTNAEHSRSLLLPTSIHDAIITHAREGKPEEICGLLRGKDDVVSDIRRAWNVALNRIMDYEIDPAALLVQFQWEDEGGELIAIYHSHPLSPAYPSASDAYNAYYPDAVYLICSLKDDDNPVLNGFHLRQHRGDIDLDVIRGDLIFDETRPGRWGAYLSTTAPTPASLTHLDLPLGLALYVVYQKEGAGKFDVRVVSVEPVAIKLV